jgi:hypothetical protein
MMADDPTEHAIDVVAHEVVARGDHKDDDAWGLYPEIGEQDWNRVMTRCDRIAEQLAPDRATYKAAYEHLESRAGES